MPSSYPVAGRYYFRLILSVIQANPRLSYYIIEGVDDSASVAMGRFRPVATLFQI